MTTGFIDLRHQYGISAAESQTFLRAKRSQRRRARRNGCFRRLVLSVLSRNQNVIFMAYLLSFGFFGFVSLHVNVIAIGVGIQYFGGNLGRPALAFL